MAEPYQAEIGRDLVVPAPVLHAGNDLNRYRIPEIDRGQLSIERCGADYITSDNVNLAGHPTDKRNYYDEVALKALNAPERRPSADLSDAEKRDADNLVQSTKDYYKSFGDPDSRELYKKVQEQFLGLDPSARDRVIDAANAQLKDSGLKYTDVPESGEAWIGKLDDGGVYRTGTLIRPESCPNN